MAWVHKGASEFLLRIDRDGVVRPENFWLPKSARIVLEGLDAGQHYDIEFALYSGDRSLYAYLPFNAWLRPVGEHGELIEVSAARAQTVVRLPQVQVGREGPVLEFNSDLGSVPAKLGLGDDERELALLLTSVEARPARPRTVPARKLSWPHGSPAETPRPIFVIGAYRSGTSITTWAIGQHPNIFALEETGWVHSGLIALSSCFEFASDRSGSAAEIYGIDALRFLGTYGRFLDRLHRDVCRERSEKVLFARLANSPKQASPNIQMLRSPRCAKSRWVDGTPENATAGRLIADVYPESQFVIMVRHPRDVIRSLQNFDRAGGRPYSTEEALKVWRKLTALSIDTARYVGTERALVVVYERLSDPRSLMRDCFAFLGEPYFDLAARAYETRINSSCVDGLKFDSSKLPGLETAEALYEQIRMGKMPSLAEFCVDGLHEFDEYLNHIKSRIDGVFRGSPPPRAH